MNRKHLVTILMTIAITGILLISSFFAQLASSAANTYGTDNMTVTGVLSSDSYVLYPYEPQNLVLGFSKYGELINGAAKQGLEYDGMDVFANSYVDESDWSQGWLIDIHYADISNHYKRAWAFALYADQSGTGGIGGDWKENCTGDPDTSTEQGGRRTNVWAATDPIQVLYDGPRRFVALTKTTLYDALPENADNALVSITITLEFNKDKKEVILFKDVKRLDTGKFGRTMQVEFSNRGEWDIGDTSAPPSYAHFYYDQPTAYDYDYHDFYSSAHPITGYDVCQMIDEAGTYVGFVAYWPQVFGKLVDGTTHIDRDTILSSICTVTKNETWATLDNDADKIIHFHLLGWASSDLYPIGAGEFSNEPMVYKNNILLTGAVDYTWATDGHITFTTEPADTDRIIVVYKHNVNAGVDDMITHAGSEPQTPYVIGEWCFDLKNADLKRQFRGVTVYGLTDRHDADDNDAALEDWSGSANVMDCEVQYLLNETFNPFDLYSAVEKQDYRWVDIRDLVTATSYITLTNGLDDSIYQPNGYSESTGKPITASQTWTGYNYTTSGASTFAWLNEYEDGIDAYSKNWVAHLNSTMTSGDETMLKITPTGFGVNGTGTLTFGNITDFGFWYYMGPHSAYGPHIEFELYNSTGTGYVVLGADRNAPSPSLATGTWIHYTLNDILSFVTPGPAAAETPFFVRYNPMAYTKDDLGALIETYEGASHMHSWEWFQERFGNFSVGSIGISARHDYNGVDCYVDDLSVAYLDLASGLRTQRVYNMEEDKLIPSDWNAYCTSAERVLVDGVLIDRFDDHLLRNYVEGGYKPYYMIDFATGNLTFYHYVTSAYTTWTLPIGTHIKVLYSTIEMNDKGRYEWMVLGKNAKTIDSAAAAYVSEAFDSTKDIRVEMIGMDIREYEYGPNSPYVVSGTGTGTRNDYNDTLGRPHLRDDWCTTWPVSSSNMIFMAGPRANLGTEYMNEFTNAFFARSEYVVNNTGQANTIMGLSCWNKNNYTSGYGVISVYKDLNGTIGLVFWGYNADDYYYTCKWFWNYAAGITCPDGHTIVYSGIEYLQHENRGVTDIILHITYPTANPTHPTVSVTEERLGTISEKHPHDP